MFIAAFLVGMREGLEASLIVGILLAAIQRRGASSARHSVWLGVALAAALCTSLGALLTFGRYGLSFKAQEAIGGILSLVAVAMITGMVLSMSNKRGTMRRVLDAKAGTALKTGSRAVFWVAFIAVAREGLELTLLMWGWVVKPTAVTGAFLGIAVAVGLGWLIYRGALTIRMSAFLAVSSALLIVVAAGVLAYAIHDLQEAQLLPGPFSGAPIAPTHPRTGEVLTGFATYPFWMASFPFGWAFNLEGSLDPAGFTATFLQAITGFEPKMSWLQVVAWLTYLAVVVPKFIRHLRAEEDAPRHEPAVASLRTLTHSPS
ncbi:Ferrous iron permease EfeU [Corynebacterium capitovis DSM 44611]|uniref:FTR1 family iron permease n=1 Tax=Corynebacterium capitovis TaxID=131081 RepID=UPI00037C601A|nr:FTR1 family protein [Corynebacterium capitovis]WKD57161.1 Ferrous iron permease EfeU [Corynebacterium capitovis DSM 44611]